jgi:glycosyltransferase involved in cell wall biosynthesis
MNPLLSILTPAIPERLEQVRALSAEIENQIGTRPVEHLVLMDNRRRSIGLKRDALLRAAGGDFVAFVDDDDWVSIHYIQELLHFCKKATADVITFRQEATIDGALGTIEFRLGNPNQYFAPGVTRKRNAWHVCAWSRRLAIQSSFPDSNYGEDWAYAAKLCALPGLRESHIPKVLHYYKFDSCKSRAKKPELTHAKI